jgi:curved DNA-binding protein CbpA
MEHAGPGRNPADPYQVLGVGTGASQRDIARAYRRAVQHAHPDARPHDRQAAARFQALTDAYDLLRNPGRRADYDRGHTANEPSGQPPQPRQPAPAPRWRGSPFLLRPPSSQHIWAGPVHIEPSATAPATSQDGRSAAATEFDDPAIILGVRPGQVWGWPW